MSRNAEKSSDALPWVRHISVDMFANMITKWSLLISTDLDRVSLHFFSDLMLVQRWDLLRVIMDPDNGVRPTIEAFSDYVPLPLLSYKVVW